MHVIRSSLGGRVGGALHSAHTGNIEGGQSKSGLYKKSSGGGGGQCKWQVLLDGQSD